MESETGSGKVSDGSFEHLQIIAAGYVAVQTGTDSLGMAHLAEDTAVRRGDAFDGKERVVGVEVYVRGRLTVRVDVLCGDLSVCGKLPDQLFTREEAPCRSDRHADPAAP